MSRLGTIREHEGLPAIERARGALPRSSPVYGAPTLESLFDQFLGASQALGEGDAFLRRDARPQSGPATTLDALAELNPQAYRQPDAFDLDLGLDALAFHSTRLQEGSPILSPADYARLYDAVAAGSGIEPSGHGVPAAGEGLAELGWPASVEGAAANDRSWEPREGAAGLPDPARMTFDSPEEQAAAMLAAYGPNPVLVALELWDEGRASETQPWAWGEA